MSQTRYIVSACLAGIACRYDGRANTCPEVQQLVAEGRAIPACPEFLGGLGMPRPPCEIVQGKVVNSNGQDVTQHFLLGAQAATEFAIQQGCTAAILKSRSPSCGYGQIYDGTFGGVLVKGDGIWAALLRQAGIALYSEENLPEDLD
ncbi:2-thiouracil desulfurase family protein [Desulfovibrio intestinalis]|uniref:Uncharacterized protein YbbK (DUF523 family) n=1 Tax=Desulfovibrio intestinalis TaxID=58621 RepID=A0A7W8C0V0_9BACT|nr:uncharacterized protein YbbK (DUF523 family) [Desulfovibrio intestinalis]